MAACKIGLSRAYRSTLADVLLLKKPDEADPSYSQSHTSSKCMYISHTVAAAHSLIIAIHEILSFPNLKS